MLTADQLIQFEKDILTEFESGNIKAPIHLSNGNEEELIGVFKNYEIGPQDWVMCTWRSHYECLLKGVPLNEVRQAILDRRSISLCFKEYNVLSSAIVGGVCPIALGVAMGQKLKYRSGRTFCFIGDMSAETGIFHECSKYGFHHDLPIYWIVGDNNKSVCTDTRKTWGYSKNYDSKLKPKVIRYHYKSCWPHAGGLRRINF